MDATRFSTGQTFEAFLQSARKYCDLWTSSYKRASIPAEIVNMACGMGGVWHIVILNEDWCLDAIGIVPPIVRLTELVDGIDVRIFGRDANPDLMDAHLTNGGKSIPIIILYDSNWIERGSWGPRPRALQTWVKEEGVKLPSEEKYRYVRTWYARDHGRSTLQEVIELIAEANDDNSAPISQ